MRRVRPSACNARETVDPARVPRPGPGAFPRHRPHDHAVLRLVCQPLARNPDPGCAVRPSRPRPRRRWGGVIAADLRGRPRRGPVLRRRDAPRRLHHATVRDLPDPRAPPNLRRDGRPRWRAESSLDSGTVRTGRHTTTRRGPQGPLSLTPTPRPRAGTFGVRVRPIGRSIGPRGDRTPTETAVQAATESRRRAAAGGGHAAAGPSALAGSAIAPYVRRMLDRARLNFRFCMTLCKQRTARRGRRVEWPTAIGTSASTAERAIGISARLPTAPPMQSLLVAYEHRSLSPRNAKCHDRRSAFAVRS